MPTWLPTWKAKSLYHVGTFLPTWFFSATSKVQNYQNKTGEKSLYPSKYVLTTCFKEFQRYFQIYLFYYLHLANCKQLRKCNRLNWLLLCHVFFQQILDPIMLELIWSCNYLASIPRHYYCVSKRVKNANVM